MRPGVSAVKERMKVLFISSGKSGRVGDVVKNQGESLKTGGIEIDFYLIKPGFLGYLFAIPKIRRAFKKGNYDLAHAHYSLSGFTAALAGCRPLVVSLMGSDAYMSGWLRVLARFFYNNKWNITIVKTKQMKELLRMDKAYVIPNGVDINRFKPFPKEDARKYLNYPLHKKLILFISNPNRPEKNMGLAEKAFKDLRRNKVELKHIYNVTNEDMPLYYNATDALLLTSKWEGSVNVVKEAMACNCPIVSTDVGDVSWVIDETEGCFITSFKSEDIAQKIQAAFTFGKRTSGRQRIIELGLVSEVVAKKIISLYREAISKKDFVKI